MRESGAITARESIPDAKEFPPAGQAAILLAAVLTSIDSFIVNVSLPSIQSSLGADTVESQFVISGYSIVYALLLVFSGRSGDRYGRRRVLVLGTLGFTAASLFCGVAASMEILIAARVVQGAFAALLLPQVMSTIQAALKEPAKTRLLSYYAAIGGLSAAVGRLLGGVIVWADLGGLGWRLIFLINLPLGVVAALGIRAWVPETRADDPDSTDIGGTLLFGAAILGLLIPLSVGRQAGWPAWAWALCVGSAAAFVALRFYESRIEISGRAPLIPPSLLAISTMRRGLLVLGSGFLVFGGYLFAFALAMQEGNSMSALESGMSMAPMALGQFLSAMRAPQIIKRYGIRSIQIGGLAQATGIAAVMLPVILFWPYSEFYHVAAGMFLIGIGNGLYVPSTYRTILSTIPDHKIGLGSGLITTVQQSALAVGVAALGAVFMGISASASMGAGFLGVGTIFLAVALSYTVLGARVADRRGRTEGLGARI